MISFDEALAIVVAQARPLEAETVALEAAAGRVLAAPVVAQVSAPPADISTMDGYALRDDDLGGSRQFRVVGAAYPGAAFAGAVARGESVRIFTGAPIPAGLDRVVIQENVERVDDRMEVTHPASPSRYIRTHGSDFRTGDVLLEPGHLLGPRALVAAAGADSAHFSVWRRPRMSIISTGDELAEPGTARDQPGTIPESASFGAAALGQAWGADLQARYRLRDDMAEMQAGAAEALERSDLVVVTGGASVGEKDFARQVFQALGAEMLFAKVAIMPGKPVWFARCGARLVVGLPGNPSSAMVTARLFLAPLLAGMNGRDPLVALRWRTARLTEALTAAGDRETFVRAREGADGVTPIASQDSGLQRALADADVLIRRVPHAAAAPAGGSVEVIDF